MNIEDFRTYCLSLAGVHDAFPFGKATSAYDRDLLVFYAGKKWFCFVNAVACDCCTIKSTPERIAELRAHYEAVAPGYHMNKKYWISVHFDRDMSDAAILELVRESYELVAKR